MATLVSTHISVYDPGTGVTVDAKVSVSVHGTPIQVILGIDELGLTQPQKDTLQNAINLLRTRAIAVARLELELP